MKKNSSVRSIQSVLFYAAKQKEKRRHWNHVPKFFTISDNTENVFDVVNEWLELFLPPRQICELSRGNDALKILWWVRRRLLHDDWHLCSGNKAVLLQLKQHHLKADDLGGKLPFYNTVFFYEGRNNLLYYSDIFTEDIFLSVLVKFQFIKVDFS